MKTVVFAAGLAGLLSIPLALAQSQIVGPAPSTLTTLDLYANVGDAAPEARHVLGTPMQPLDVLETRSGHHRVVVNGKEYWVKNTQVRISRGSSAGCTTAKIAPTTQTTSTPGAGKHVC
jgi:hypothetical protein